MTEQFIQQQVAEFTRNFPSARAPKKETATEIPKVAQSVAPAPVPKISGVIQLQCTNFPNTSESSESSESPEYSDDSDDNIASDSDSCACDEDGKCDHHWMQEALIEYARREHAKAQISAKK
jgi:hypothetical protein